MVNSESQMLLDKQAIEAIKSIFLDLLVKARSKFTRLGKGDEEALHDIRVAGRRMSVWLKIATKHKILKPKKKLLKLLKQLRKLTNRVRDHEVHLAILEHMLKNDGFAKTKVPSFKSDWEREVQNAYEFIAQELPPILIELDHSLGELISGLAKDALKEHEQRNLRDFLYPIIKKQAKVLDRFLARIHSIDDEHPAHEARLIAKSLRYLIEPIVGELKGGELILKRFRLLQDLLGDVRDHQVLLPRLDRLGKKIQDSDLHVLGRVRERTQLGLESLFLQTQTHFLGNDAEAFEPQIKNMCKDF